MIAKIIDNNNIEIIDLTQFDADAIMHSGQVFRYFPKENGYELVVGKNYAEISKKNDKAFIRCNDSNYFWNYFDLDTDYSEIKNELQNYKSIRLAIEAGGGIRILRSDFYEMVISFIISANNNIKRFTKTLNGLAEKYGERLQNGLYSFPTLEQLSLATEDDYKALGCGYRSAYLVRAVKQLGEISITELQNKHSSEVDIILRSIKGVGAKVSCCIRLFSVLHDLSVCPLDTWLKKALTQIDEQDHEVLLNHRYAGVAQQYIFYYLQHLRKEI